MSCSEGRTPVVTIVGGEAEVVRALVERFAGSGWVVVLARSALPPGLDVSPTLGIHDCDVRSEPSVVALRDHCIDRYGGCDAVVYAEAVSPEGSLTELSLTAWDEALGVNLVGAFLVLRHFAGLMIDAGAGSVVVLSSIVGTKPVQRRGAYAASAAALSMLVRQAAVEWARFGVRVNEVRVGEIEDVGPTGVTDLPGVRSPFLRAAEPDEIAAVVAFLVSSDASYVTAQSLDVDGALVHTTMARLRRPGVPSLFCEGEAT